MTTATTTKIESTFTTDAKDLSAALALVLPAISKKTYIPILSNVLIVADSKHDKLTLHGNDLETYIEKTIFGFGGADLAVTVAAHTLRDVLKGAKGSVTLIDQGANLKIEGAVNVTLPTLPAEDYPPCGLPRGSEIVASFDAPTDSIRKAFIACDQASNECARGAVLMGTLLEIKPGDDNVNLVATDGYKLGWFNIKGAWANKEAKAILPNRFAYLMRKLKKDGIMPSINLCHKPKDEVTLFAEFLGGAGSYRIVTRCVDGQYPNYDMFVPKQFDLEVTVPVTPFLATIKAASNVAGDKAKMINLDVQAFHNAERQITVTASSDDKGSFSNKVPIADSENRACGEIKVAFNGEYLADCVESFDLAETITLRFLKPLSPVMIKNGTADYVVLMPLRP